MQVEGSENKQANKCFKISTMNITNVKTALDKVKQAKETFSSLLQWEMDAQNNWNATLLKQKSGEFLRVGVN